MATIPAPVAEPQPAISPIGRIFGIFFSPKATFEDIVRKPGWLLPVIILAVLGLAVAMGLNQKMNWREFMSQQIEKIPQASTMSAEQKEPRIQAGATFTPLTPHFFRTPAPLLPIPALAPLICH